MVIDSELFHNYRSGFCYKSASRNIFLVCGHNVTSFPHLVYHMPMMMMMMCYYSQAFHKSSYNDVSLE